MADFIDKDTFLKDALKEPLMHHTLLYEIVERQPIVHIDDMTFKIQNELQAANPSGIMEITFVRRGRWIETTVRGNQSIICSACSAENQTICPSNFCPNCGARMDSTDTNVGGKGGADE